MPHSTLARLTCPRLVLGLRVSDGGGNSLDRIVSIALAVAALAMAAAVVVREVAPPVRPPSGPPTPEVKYHSGWLAFLSDGRQLGSGKAPVQLVEFSDLECPACRTFHLQTLPAVQAEFAGQLDVTLVHLPLRIHRFARRGAEAAECAADQAKFAEFVSQVFAKQDSIGLKEWKSFASDAGLRELASFEKCLQRGGKALVDAGRKLADSLGLNGTPTVMINGWQLAQPSQAEITRVVRSLLQGSAPYALK